MDGGKRFQGLDEDETEIFTVPDTCRKHVELGRPLFNKPLSTKHRDVVFVSN